jgi:integrase
MEHLPDARPFDSSSGSLLPIVRHPRQDFYDELSDATRALLMQTIPEETRTVYTREWNRFAEWCATQQRNPLPASEADLVEWVAYRIAERHGPSRIGQGIGAVRRIHHLAGYRKQPFSEDAWALLRQYKVTRLDEGWRPTKSATVTVEEFRRMVATLPADTLSGVRDRAILAIGLSGFFRRSNIIRLDLGDVMPTEWGDLKLYVTRSKTDQSGRGRTRIIPPGEDPLSDPVGLLNAWLNVLKVQGIAEGPLFRPVSRAGRVLDRRINPDWVRRVVKKAAAEAGLKSLKNRPYRAHTLRSSGVTVARRAGKSWDLIREQGDWSKESNVVYEYDQPEEQDNAMRGVL